MFGFQQPWSLCFICSVLLGCASAPITVPAAYSGRFPPQTQRFDRLRLQRVTQAPLRSFAAFKIKRSCRGLLKVLQNRPEAWLNSSWSHWDHSQSAQGPRRPGEGSLLTFDFAGQALTARFHTVAGPKKRSFSYSFVRERHGENWPYTDHLAVVTVEPSGRSCWVTLRHHHNEDAAFFSLPSQSVSINSLVEVGQRSLKGSSMKGLLKPAGESKKRRNKTKSRSPSSKKRVK